MYSLSATLLPDKGNLFCIQNDYIITTIYVWSVIRLVLTSQKSFATLEANLPNGCPAASTTTHSFFR